MEICKVKAYEKDEFKRLADNLRQNKKQKAYMAKYRGGADWEVNFENSLDYLVLAKWRQSKNCKLPSFRSKASNTEIHIGQDIAREVLGKMALAKKRIYIAVPFIGKSTMEHFDFLSKEEIDAKILFSIEEDTTKYSEIFNRILDYKIEEDPIKKQNQEKELEKLREKEQEEMAKKYWPWLLLLLAVLASIAFAWSKLLVMEERVLMLVGAAAFLLGSYSLFKYFSGSGQKNKNLRNLAIEKTKVENWEIRRVDYMSKNTEHYRCLLTGKEQLEENGKVNFTDRTYSHMKLYIVDDVAFIGSMNYSNTSFANLEALVEIKDKEVVDELATYFQKLYKDERSFHTPRDLSEYLGRKMYPENEVLWRSR